MGERPGLGATCCCSGLRRERPPSAAPSADLFPRLLTSPARRGPGRNPAEVPLGEGRRAPASGRCGGGSGLSSVSRWPPAPVPAARRRVGGAGGVGGAGEPRSGGLGARGRRGGRAGVGRGQPMSRVVARGNNCTKPQIPRRRGFFLLWQHLFLLKVCCVLSKFGERVSPYSDSGRC